MDGERLTAEQRAALLTQLDERLVYLLRLVRRMDARRWRAGCPVYVRAVDARRAVTALRDAVVRLESITVARTKLLAPGTKGPRPTASSTHSGRLL
jgi:hypothetical protein